MKMLRVSCSFLFLLQLLWLLPARSLNAQQQIELPSNRDRVAQATQSPLELFQSAKRVLYSPAASYTMPQPSSSEASSIKEEIPDKYRARYEEWKREFLSTETGHTQWEMYEHNKRFVLTINISTDNPHGATTGKYRWNDAGELIGATITLGYQLDEGYPDPVYYPVMNSLSLTRVSEVMSGKLLAATKIAHEFGHMNQAISADGKLYRLQNQLMPVYKRIFLSNGHNTHDPRLIKIAQQMGGTSVEVWADREYWGEANAMLYLRDRISEKSYRCILFDRIRHSIEEYAVGYAERFRQVALSPPALCDWR